ncbi:MAG: orotate phosphoribosyltransferase [Crenarchaeota archaeon]|nr:orotate phosphoribosyltransferase [Thermoproteota archaeon]
MTSLREQAYRCVLSCVFKASDRCFKLSSGKLSPYYIDLRRILFGDPRCLEVVSRAIYEEFLRSMSFDILACKALGAVPLLVTLSLITKKPMLVLREKAKEHGMGGNLVGPIELVRDRQVVIIDDVCTTGSTILQVARTVRELGGNVKYAIVVVDREEGCRDNLRRESIELLSLFTRTDLGISDDWLREAYDNLCREA